MYKTRSPTLKRFKWYIVDLKTTENTTKTKVIKTYQNHILDVGMFPCPLTLSDGGKRLRLGSSWSLLLGPYTWSKVHKSPCVGGMILPPYEIQEICIQALQVESRNTSLLHLGVCAYFCIARSFGVNANSWFSCPMFLTQNKQKQILHLSIGKLEKTVEQFETSLDESNFRSFKIWQ